VVKSVSAGGSRERRLAKKAEQSANWPIDLPARFSNLSLLRLGIKYAAIFFHTVNPATIGVSLMRGLSVRTLVAAVVALSVSQSFAALPFVEDFDGSAENWRISGAVDANWVATGGPDGGSYISNSFTKFDPPPPSFPGASASLVVFRAQEEYGSVGSSNSEYTGNWLAAGIKEVTAWVRHDAGVPLAYNFRFSDPANSPGASYGTAAVQSGVWTKLTIDVTPTSAQWLTYGGGSHATIFDNIGHIQVSAVEPAAWTAADVNFDLDRVIVAVPEPASLALGGLALACVALIARRRN
jgi:hypothetical protein